MDAGSKKKTVRSNGRWLSLARSCDNSIDGGFLYCNRVGEESFKGEYIDENDPLVLL